MGWDFLIAVGEQYIGLAVCINGLWVMAQQKYVFLNISSCLVDIATCFAFALAFCLL